jgi:hypothetical protein
LHPVVRGLAHAFFSGPWTLSGLRERGSSALGSKPRWLKGLCQRAVAHFDEAPSEVAPVLAFIVNDEQLRNALARPQSREYRRVRRWFLESDRMSPVEGPPARFGVPAISTEGDLAAHLGVSTRELPWFADLRRMHAARCEQQLRHYRYRWVQKPSGGLRLLETPKPRLKVLQRKLLSDLLSRCPPHDAAHGFVANRSVLTFAREHVGRRVVLRLDLEDFFLSIGSARIAAIFRRLGYPAPVARVLTGLCCTVTPDDVIAAARPALDFHSATRMRSAHLAQGAPTSPALSNLTSFRLDCRLRALAHAAGASYSRYADDLAFSGGRAFERGVSHFIVHASAIALKEGFRVRHRKTLVMRAGGRQSLTGLVLNERLNVPRPEYDRLRAILHNAARFGPQSQNRTGHADFRAHLLGQIAWIAASNTERAVKLHGAFALIEWPGREAE